MAVKVFGKVIDDQTRCIHYQTPSDIIAIKFKCCSKYYPCHVCHDETTDHHSIKWSKSEFDEKAILCGACKAVLTINDYMSCKSSCPKCQASFNPNCELHYPQYFKFV